MQDQYDDDFEKVLDILWDRGLTPMPQVGQGAVRLAFDAIYRDLAMAFTTGAYSLN